jgi:hypothetical protein
MTPVLALLYQSLSSEIPSRSNEVVEWSYYTSKTRLPLSTRQFLLNISPPGYVYVRPYTTLLTDRPAAGRVI